MAPDVDQRLEQLYGYLHDDVTRRRASVGLALELCAVAPASAEGRRRLGPSSPLISGGLLVIDDRERPVLTRSLRVPDRVAAHLLGDDALEPAIAELLLDSASPTAGPWPHLDNAIASFVSPIYLREQLGTSAAWVAASAVDRAFRPSLEIDVARLVKSADPRDAAAVAVREARLGGRVLIASNLDASADRSDIISVLADAPVAVILAGARAWDPAWSRSVPLTLETPHPTAAERADQWASVLNGHSTDAEFVRATLAFRLTPAQAARAAIATHLASLAQGRAAEPADLQSAARAQNAAG
ncbi:MAG TPA: hypothetical protein VIK00_06500, partial [Candidatus Limnocylindrales bacterium]